MNEHNDPTSIRLSDDSTTCELFFHQCWNSQGESSRLFVVPQTMNQRQNRRLQSPS